MKRGDVMKGKAKDPEEKRKPTVVTVGGRLVRRAEAARYLCVSTAQLDVLRDRGEIDVVLMPGRNGDAIRTPLFDRNALDKAIERWTQQRGRP